MDVHAAIRDDGTLRRIIATLVALAVLAERAGNAPFPVRWLVLCLLRHAEVVAREFAAKAMPPLAIEETPVIQNGPADAILLASRFRGLAALLGVLLCLAYRSACRDARIDGALRRLAPCPGQLPTAPGGWRRMPNDTS